MTTPRLLHNEAMSLAQDAYMARETGQDEQALGLAARALELEVDAAEMIPLAPESEPTRSILYRSAASLAMQARQFERALRLAGQGLAGFPPPRVISEITDLIGEIQYQANLDRLELRISDQNVKFRLSGPGVGPGQVRFRELDKRLSAFFKLTDRMFRNRQGQPFQARGPAPKRVERLEPVIAGFEAGSFIVNVRFEIKKNLLWTTPFQAVNDVIDGLDMVQANDFDRLSQHVGGGDYFEHFVGQAREMAPDGEAIASVYVTTSEREVSFTSLRDEILAPISKISEVPSDRDRRTLEGLLQLADASQNLVRLNTKDFVVVREGLKDVVQEYFGEQVAMTVETVPGQRYPHLIAIDPIGE